MGDRQKLAVSRQCRHQVACRIPDIQPRHGTPWLFKLDDPLDRQVVAGCRPTLFCAHRLLTGA